VAGSAVWVDVLPSMAQLGPQMTAGATRAARTAGTAAGRQFSASVAAGAAGGAGANALVRDLEAAQVKITRIINTERTNIFRARTAETAATQQVAAAEARLVEVRTSSGAASSQALAAEAQLTTARGRQQVAAMRATQVEDQLRAAYREQRLVTAQLGEAQLTQTGRTLQARNGLAGLAAAGAPVVSGLGRAGGAIRNIAGEALGAVKPLASMAAGFGAIIGISKVISLGNAYTKTMNEFKAVTSSTDEVMKEVSQTARELGSDLTLPATSGADAAAIMVELAKGGLTANDAMDAAKGTILLAAAAQMEGAEAAEVQASAINQFGLAAKDAGMVADVLANTANAAAGGVSDIATSLKYVGPSARAMGISIGDTAAAIGLLANNGIKGDTAGTALRGMLVSLAAPSKQAQKAMNALGIEAFDSQGNFVGLRSVIDQLAVAQSNMSQEQFTSASALAFGREPLSAITALASSGATAFDDMAGAVTRQGGAAEVAGSQMFGLGGAMDKLESQLEDVALTIYETVAPGLTAAVGAIANGLDGAGGKVSAFLATAGGLGKLVFAGDYTGSLQAGLGLSEDSIPVDVILDARDRVIGGFQSIVTFVQQSLLPSLVNIGTALGPLAAIILGVLVFAFQGLATVLETVVGPALVAITGFLADNPGVVIAFAAALGVLTAAFYAQKAVLAIEGAGGLLAYVKTIKVVRTATALWAAGQWALNTALLANPVGLVILAVVAIVAAIAALVAGLVWAYQNVGWFRDGVNGALDGIMIAVHAVGDAGVWLWENALKPAWDAIAAAAVWLYETVLRPAFDGIGAAVLWVGAIFQANLAAWQAIFAAVGAAASWLWNNIFVPVFSGIASVIAFNWAVISAIFDLLVHVIVFVVGAALTWLWENVVSPVFTWIGDKVAENWRFLSTTFGLLVAFVRFTLGLAFTWLYETIIRPVFDKIAAAASYVWTSWLLPIFTAISSFVTNVLGPAFTWWWENVVMVVFNAVRDKISDVWNNYIRPVFDALSDTVQNKLPKAFEMGRDAIGKAWEGLKELAKAPIRFVVDTIINDGLIGNFNKLADFFGSKKIPEISLPKGFAGGGVIPGYQSQKRDDVMMPMRRGEGVLVPEVVKALGPGFVHTLNAAGNRGGASAVKSLTRGDGLAEGGIVGGAIDWIKDKAGAASSFMSDPAGSFGKVLAGVTSRIPGAEGLVDLAKGATSKLVGMAVDAVKKLIPAAGSAAASGPNGRLPQGGMLPVSGFRPGGGVGALGGYLRADAARAWEMAQAASGGRLSLTEGYRDLAAQQYRWALYQAGGNLAARPGTSNHGNGLAADIGTGGQSWLAKNGPTYGWYPTGLGFRQREPWHFDYKGKGGNGSTGMYEGGVIEPTLYDDGGLLNRGVSVIKNSTTKPEYALPEDRLVGIVEKASGNSQAPLVGNLTLQSSGDTNEDLDEVMFKLRTIRRGGKLR
jgi:TP901 family phage tail tape measure protein